MANANASLDIPQKPVVRRAWIKFRLLEKGSTPAKLAADLEVSRQAVEDALLKPNARIEQVIADKIGVPVELLFSERFDANGIRLHKVRNAQRSREATPRNVKRAGAR